MPGRCDIGDAELELHPATGHTIDGMAIWIPLGGRARGRRLPLGVELPDARRAASARMLDAYLATLERLRPLVAPAEHVVPGHGPVLDREAALRVLDEDVAYLQRPTRARAPMPSCPSGGSQVQRELHAQNVARV